MLFRSKFNNAKLEVTKGQKVQAGATIITASSGPITTINGGVVTEVGEVVTVKGTNTAVRDFLVPVGVALWVKDGELVVKGQQLTEGSLDLHELYALKGKEAVQKYILKEIQFIYGSQGQKLNDKHIELIIRQMFSRVFITEAGSTELLPGEVVTVAQFEEANEQAKNADKPIAQGDLLLLGITKSSLSTDSFLSAASFQETARVLIDAAVTGKVDNLRGLKENVIIGRLIPAGTGLGEKAKKLNAEKIGRAHV